MASQASTIHGRYQLSGSPIGQGGMGVVFKAYDVVTKRYVALKTMRGSLSPAALDLFTKEWSVLAQLSHPNIVDVLDTGEFEQDGQVRPFFVMPFLPGSTLDQLMQNASARLTLERTVGIIAQTCRGLQAAHERGLIHRDLKPSNIFVMDDDAVKIIDFGIVHLAGAESVAGLKGTLQYMSPEQIDLKPASAASDIFALGVVCYEALTGRKPFQRRSEVETADAIRRQNPAPICDLNPLVSQMLSRVIHKAMAKDPYHRFASAREFSECLQRVLNGETIERFDPAKLQPRIERIRKAQSEGDHQFASEILGELEAEGNIDPEMSLLRMQLDHAIRQKSIRQLLDSARTRMEEEEFPLAQQKIQEVLELDPDNADAVVLRKQIDQQRSLQQAENWFRLVEQHLRNRSFQQARQGLEEILKVHPNDNRARELLVDVERREEEASRVRSEKEDLYQAAINCYNRGEISSALTRLERILEMSQQSADAVIPERDAQYQSLYNQVRSEREVARSAYAEGRRSLADRNFSRALDICNEYLNKNPEDPMFQALKLEVEDQRRQEQSAFLADVARRVDAEVDLDRRVNILRDAVDRYPGDPHLQQSMRLTRERRDLVNSIVAKAHQYEERGHLNEALSQLDILRNIYAQYPGLDFETERLKRRRDDQVRSESKGRWVEQIDRHIAQGDYPRARDLVRTALAEFPADAELNGLAQMAQSALERGIEAEDWLGRGQQLCFDRQFGEGLEALRKAASLDSRNPVIRAALLNALVEHARSVLGQDWRAAEPLVEQALSIDGGHPLARSIQGLVLDYKRQDLVTVCVAQARSQQAAGDLNAALSTVEAVLAAYPNELRLAQLRQTLRNLGAVSAESPAIVPQAPNDAARQSDRGMTTEILVPTESIHPSVFLEPLAAAHVEAAKIDPASMPIAEPALPLEPSKPLDAEWQAHPHEERAAQPRDEWPQPAGEAQVPPSQEWEAPPIAGWDAPHTNGWATAQNTEPGSQHQNGWAAHPSAESHAEPRVEGEHKAEWETPPRAAWDASPATEWESQPALFEATPAASPESNPSSEWNTQPRAESAYEKLSTPRAESEPQPVGCEAQSSVHSEGPRAHEPAMAAAAETHAPAEKAHATAAAQRTPQPPTAAPPPGDALDELWYRIKTTFEGLAEPRGKWKISRLEAFMLGTVPILLTAAFLVTASHQAKKAAPAATTAASGSFLVDVETEPTGARFQVDGNASLSFPLRLNAGDHQVVASAPGYKTTVKTFHLASGAPRPFVVALQLVPEMARMRLTSDLKSGKLAIDGQAVDLEDGGFGSDKVRLSADHTVTVAQSGKPVLEFSFRAEPGVMAALSTPLKTKDVDAVVIANLGARARVYASDGSWKGGLKGQTPQPIPPEGLELNDVGADAEFVLDNGKSPRPIPVEIANTPSLAIFVTSNPNQGTLEIEANVPNADLYIDGRKRRPLRAGKNYIGVEPGAHTISIAHDGYDPSSVQKIDLKRGEVKQLAAFTLKPAVKTATLAIEGGTRDAEVWMDGRQIGNMNADGSFRRDDIAPAGHTITLKKADFEDKELSRTFTVGDAVRINGTEAQLTPYGSVEFKVTPPNVAVTYKRADEPQVHTAENGKPMHLRAGRYAITAAGSGVRPRTDTITIEPGKAMAIDWTLASIEEVKKAAPQPKLTVTKDYFLNSTTWEQDGERATHETSGMSWLRNSQGVYTIELFRQTSKIGPIKRTKRVEWVVDQKDDGNHVDYAFEFGSLERRATVDGKTQPRVKVPTATGESYTLQIEIRPERITIRDAQGKELDQYDRPNSSEALGKFGFKGDVELVVRKVE